MSQLAKFVQDQLKPDDKEANEQIAILRSWATSKLEKYQSDLRGRFTDQTAFKNEILPMVEGGLFDETTEYRVNVSEKADDAVNAMVDSFFQGSGDGIKDGFKAAIQLALQSILGSTSAGEQEFRRWFINIEYGQIIRTDFSAWRYNFEGSTVIKVVKSAYCFFLAKSFADLQKLRPNQLSYFVAKSLNVSNIEDLLKDPRLASYVKALENQVNKGQNSTNGLLIEEYRRNKKNNIVPV